MSAAASCRPEQSYPAHHPPAFPEIRPSRLHHQTPDWLDYYDISYRDLCLMSDKGAVGAHVYIDDVPGNIIRLRKQGCNTIMFTNSINRNLPGPRADNWEEFERLVMEAREE